VHAFPDLDALFGRILNRDLCFQLPAASLTRFELDLFAPCAGIELPRQSQAGANRGWH
jgi:hypothetical protein